MPLVKRQIEPVHIGRKKMDARVRTNELEAVAVNLMGGFMRQLSDLARQSDDLFNELLWESESITSRANSLTLRLKDLRERLIEIECDEEDDDYEDMFASDHFKSRQKPIQQLFTADSRPLVVQESYLESDPPPSLWKFNEFHPPKTNCMDRYSYPRYFFELWAQGELQKQTARKNARRKTNSRNKTFSEFSRTWTKTDVQRVKVKTYDRLGQEFASDSRFGSSNDLIRSHLTIASGDSGFQTGSESDLRSIGMSQQDNTLRYRTMSVTGIGSADLFGKKDKRSGTLSRLFSRKKSAKSMAAKERAALRDLFDLESQQAGSQESLQQATASDERRLSTTASEQVAFYTNINEVRPRSVSDATALQHPLPYEHTKRMRMSQTNHLSTQQRNIVHHRQQSSPSVAQTASYARSVKKNGISTMATHGSRAGIQREASPIYEVPPTNDKLDVIRENMMNGDDFGQLNMSLSSQVEQLLRSRSDKPNSNQLSIQNSIDRRSDVSSSTSGIESDIQSSASSTSSGTLQKQLSEHPLLRKTLSQMDTRSQSSSVHSSPLVPRCHSMKEMPREPLYDAVASDDVVAKHDNTSGYSEPQLPSPATLHTAVNKPKKKPSQSRERKSSDRASSDRKLSDRASSDRKSSGSIHLPHQKSIDSAAGEVIAVHVENNDVYYARHDRKKSLTHSESTEIDPTHSPSSLFISQPSTVVAVQVPVTSFSSSATRKSTSDERRDSLRPPGVRANFDLLAAIRKGKQLRNVDREQHQREVAAKRSVGPMGFTALDVASILARRVAIEDEEDRRSNTSASTGDNLDSDGDWD